MALAMNNMRSAVSSKSFKPSRRVVAPRAALLTDVKVAKRSIQQQERKAPPAGFEIGFTPSNELLLGRLSMLGFGSAVIGEFLSGQGVLAQLGYELGLQQQQVGLFLAGLIGFNLVASLLPNSATFKQEQQQQRQDAVGPLQDPNITLLEPAKFFGVTNWGFTPQNELFAGRLAALGIVAAIVGELVTGLGPVGQLSLETGVPEQNIFFVLAAWASFMACTAVNKLAVKRKSKTMSSRTSNTATSTTSQ